MNKPNANRSRREANRPSGIPEKFTPEGIARRSAEASARANLLPGEEQMSRFLKWLKVTDAGHQPC
jgi:hypothetical protein